MRRRQRALTPGQLTIAWQSASLLLDYPDEGLAEQLDLIEGASAELPDRIGDPLRACVRRLRGVPLGELAADYVETFDSRRRHNLFLTYFAHGDTRKRGMALLRFKQSYLASGVDLDSDAARGAELPDHLCVVLEYAATVDREQGRRLLLDHRAGLELLRVALTGQDSRWAGAIEAVTGTFPPLLGEEVEAIGRLAADGPPAEEVGLTPYLGPTPLPMPTYRGHR